MTNFNYVFELYSKEEAISPYGVIDTKSPDLLPLTIDDFQLGEHFRTGPELSTNSLILKLDNRIITFILDESGSNTWNDYFGDRYTYIKRLLQKLENTYPGSISINLIGFGGVITKTKIFAIQNSDDALRINTSNSNFGNILQSRFQDSVFDFAGVRVVRRSDRFPAHPADGFIVAEGILDAVKDEDLVINQTYYYGVWTFNKNLLFSNGLFIKSSPNDRILPKGVNFATATPRVLPGVTRDVNTDLILNFLENSGRITFDSSRNGFHGLLGSQVVEENFWAGTSLGSTNKPTGIRFDGIFDILEFDIDSKISHRSGLSANAHALVVNFWIYPYKQVGEHVWIIGTQEHDTTSNVGWAIGITPNDTIGVKFDSSITSGFDDTFSQAVTYETWQMYTIIIDVSGVSVLKNGSLVAGTHVGGGNSEYITKLFVGARPDDSSTAWTGKDYRGSIAQVSIHSNIRNPSYWSELYQSEVRLINPPLATNSQNSPDNGQREVILGWEIEDSFDFSGGLVNIVRKYGSVPSHSADGDLVISRQAESGSFFYLDTYDFNNNTDYYYRIFTVNNLGIESDRSDARILSVHIPKSINPAASPELENISDILITSGNKKILIQWQNPSDTRIKGIRIFVGNKLFPTFSQSANGEISVSNGIELADLTDDSFYVHRSMGKSNAGTDLLLTNGITYYYSIISYDRLGRYSDPILITAVPTSLSDETFPSLEVKDLHVEIINPETLSLQWIMPIIKSDQLNLFFNESALIFVSVKDIYGGFLEDISNIKMQVCTTIKERGLKTSEKSIGREGDENDDQGCFAAGVGVRIDSCNRPYEFQDDCNDEREELETKLTYTVVESGLIKGFLTHINDRLILSRRQKYTMDVVARYLIEDQDKPGQPLFLFTTEPIRVTFTHPIKISAINKLNKKILVGCGQDGKLRGSPACECSDNIQSCTPSEYNGGYINSTRPYVCRIEIQYKGESLPDGAPVQVALFKHGTESGPNPLLEKSTRTFIREGLYPTSIIQSEEIDDDGNPTGNLINKSIVDIEIQHPLLPDFVDLYVTLDFLGFFIDVVHEVRFIGSLFLSANISRPTANGIETAEQFATIWMVDPDDPENPDKTIPVPDGTLVKWELKKLLFAKERPFYSIENLSELLAGVYSSTISGVARNVFFGPVGNIQNHNVTIKCDEDIITCCVGEEYAIQASVIFGEDTATDGLRFNYSCLNPQSGGLRFFMNASVNQFLAGGPQSSPHWIAWADGIHMIKIQIAQNPATITDDEMFGASCFRDCIESVFSNQLLPFPLEHVVQISAPAEILWDVVFDTDPYTGELEPISFESVSPVQSETLGMTFSAPVPIRGPVTDVYMRLNAFVNTNNPMPQDCEQNNGGGATGGETGLLPCEWKNICNGVGMCSAAEGVKWVNVSKVTGTSTLIINNKEVALFGGGSYDDGIPPIYIGFREPLSVKIIDVRVNGERVNDLIVDGTSRHTFTIEVTFAGGSVPDGTPVELQVVGEDQDIVILSNCSQSQPFCNQASSGRVFTVQVNDPLINPQDEFGTIQPKSLAYFSIDPLPNIQFNARINTICRYDKLNTVEREIVSCIEINNTVNVSPPEQIPDNDDPIEQSATSNETLVYDSLQDLYQLTRSGKIQRMGHFFGSVSESTNDYIYSFGGYTGSANSTSANITSSTEIFNVSLQEWSFLPDMPTARAYGMTVVVDDDIYCIGGVELDGLLSQYVVSRQIEVFSTTSQTWMQLSSMPIDLSDGFGVSYGVAYGNAQHHNGYIYVTCGITNIVDNSKTGLLNNKILRYSISSNEWDIINPSNIDLYQRLSPFGFFRSSPYDSTSFYYYVYGGSIPKTEETIASEKNSIVNNLMNELRSFILSSSYFQGLTFIEQSDFIAKKEQEIIDGVNVPAFIYPTTGFYFSPGSEIEIDDVWTVNIDNTVDSLWPTLPKPRSHGVSVYIPDQDSVYFIGGSNQNNSTTINRNESIDLSTGDYSRLTSMSRGRAMFAAALVGSEIYISGGLTSGHKAGYVEITVEQFPEFTEARGTETSGILITLRNDSGEVINENIRVAIRGRMRIPEIDSVLSDFIAARAADRALGGDGSGNAPVDTSGDEIDIDELIKAQNKIIDPNSDEFQFNAARKLSNDIFLFPILYSSNEVEIRNGIGSVQLLPRSEDPLADFQKLSEFIKSTLNNTPVDPNERFEGDLTREELAALGDALTTIQLPPITINSGSLRKLYEIETTVTILDDFYFGQTISDFDLNIQEQIDSKIIDLLTPPEIDQPTQGPGLGMFGGNPVEESECFVLQHSAQPDIPPSSTPPQMSPTNPSGTGGFSQSGQCIFCQSILPLTVDIRPQLPTVVTIYYNRVDWVPQIKKRITDLSTISEALEEIDIIDHEVPFGGSQLYNAMFEAARVTSGEDFDNFKKSIYIVSDNSQNLSLVTRDEAIEEINSIDGDKKVPIIYTVFSTSFPTSISSQLERNEVGDIDKITHETGGQSNTLISSEFLDQILNLTLGGATGGLGYGVYTRLIEFDELSYITSMSFVFELPPNTQGFVRYRYSIDGFNFNDFSERFENVSDIDITDFIAKKIEFEIILTTGFTEDITEEYDSVSTALPKLTSITINKSGEREDFLFTNLENTISNIQQVAAAVDADSPKNSIIEIGVATSNSHHWSDFQSPARPSLIESGKTIILDRTKDIYSNVSAEFLTSEDNKLYNSVYGAWDPESVVSLYSKEPDKAEVEVTRGYVTYPRDGQIYFDTRQHPQKQFRLAITNQNKLRVGIRIRNLLHTESIKLRGLGYIYSTNDQKPPALSQVAPRVINVTITPTSPTSESLFNLEYTFIDLNNNQESGTIINWYINSNQIFEIQNKKSWSNINLLIENKLKPNDKIRASVTPMDGRDFGTVVYSSTVVVVPIVPGVTDLRIVPIANGIINNRYDTSSTLTVEYNFSTNDTGLAALEDGTIIRWFVNGSLFKEGTFSTIDQDPYLDPKSIEPNESSLGTLAHVIGNQVQVEVTPRTSLITGETMTSGIINIENTIPKTTGVSISPEFPTQNSTLALGYTINDIDITTGIQQDQTEIVWLKSADGTNFVEVPELRGLKFVPPSNLLTSLRWKARITPSDGLDLGVAVDSNVVIILA